MNFNAYITGIDFRFNKPQKKFPGYRSLSRLLSGLNIQLEIANTKLPEGHKEMREKLHRFCTIPK